MFWILLAVSSHFLWSITNVSEKYLIDKRVKNPFTYLFLGFLSSVVSLAVLPFIHFYFPGWWIIFLLFVSALGYFLGGILYILSLQKEEISRINIWWNLLPIYSLFIAWFFIGEKLNTHQLLAIVVLICGAVLASMHARGNKISFSRGAVCMLSACLFYSVYDVSLRYVTRHIPFFLAYVYITIFLLLLNFLLLGVRSWRKDWPEERKNLTWKLVGLIILITVVVRVGLLLNTWAISLGPVALVNALEGSQTIFVFAITVFLTLFFPKFLREEIDKKNVLLKCGALVLVLIGILFLSFG